MKRGMKISKQKISEWVGPLCLIKSKKNKSMSGRIEAVNKRAKLILLLTIFAEYLPRM